MNWFYLSLTFGILLGVVGQFLLKAAADADTLPEQFLAPQSILGLMFYFTAALCYMYALRGIPVSVAFPAVSLSYVLVVGVAYWRFDEPLGLGKLSGVFSFASACSSWLAKCDAKSSDARLPVLARVDPSCVALVIWGRNYEVAVRLHVLPGRPIRRPS